MLCFNASVDPAFLTMKTEMVSTLKTLSYFGHLSYFQSRSFALGEAWKCDALNGNCLSSLEDLWSSGFEINFSVS